ncbi:hypothetical protein [Halopenitus sp. POP-27]|uniref:hypothetical protein n=1 Tax=Halopenitus sp. POP-27 TaxID=2994425 RepID=UPI00246965BE|nr:hypothetical protein [Halopenitus sp. POP-27]
MSNDDPSGLSRRTVLAGLGTIGVGSAGAGFGTTAYLNDAETFAGNAIAAGTLDLKIDWEEHYFDGSAGTEYGRYLTEIEDPGDRRGFPSDDPVFVVPQENVGDFMDATALEAYPDDTDDGVQSPPAGWDDPESDEYVCALGADTPEDMDPRADGAGTGLRTDNDDTWNDEEGTPKPLVSLSDVKPCDFGEVTLSYHLCDNPGYIWLTGELTENAQNGYTDPELERLTELYDGLPEEGQLAEQIFVRLWYDDGDNLIEDDETEIIAGPLGSVLALLEQGRGIPLSPNGSAGGADGPGDAVPPAVVPVGDDGITLTEDDCHVEQGNPSCADHGLLRAIKVESEDLPGGLGESLTYGTAVGTVTITVTDWDDEDDEVLEFDVEFDGFQAHTVIVKGGSNANVCSRSEDGEILTASAGEGLGAPFRTGDRRYGVSHVSICYDAETPDPDPDPDPDPRCFEPSTTHYVGLEWWLPCTVGNEVQTDSVGFDLGFYAEQCRHNESPGVGNATGSGSGNATEDGNATGTENGNETGGDV